MHFCKDYPIFFALMATHKPKLKTVYLISTGGEVIQAASTLPKLVGESLHGKSYYYYYRKLSNSDTVLHVWNGITYKIQRLNYG